MGHMVTFLWTYPLGIVTTVPPCITYLLYRNPQLSAAVLPVARISLETSSYTKAVLKLHCSYQVCSGESGAT